MIIAEIAISSVFLERIVIITHEVQVVELNRLILPF